MEYPPETEDVLHCEPEGDTHPVTDRKYIVFEKQLVLLLRRCQECGEPIKRNEKKTTGSMITVTSTCVSGHRHVWHSQPSLGRAPVGNILIAAAILMSGLYQAYSLFASLLNLAFIARSAFFDIQKHLLWPVIDQTWHDHVGSLQIWAASQPTISLAGDARCDSPGYSA